MSKDIMNLIKEIRALSKKGTYEVALLTLDHFLYSHENLPVEELALIWQEKCILLLKLGLHEIALEEAKYFSDQFSERLGVNTRINWQVLLGEIHVEMEHYDEAQAILQESLDKLEALNSRPSKNEQDNEQDKKFSLNEDELRAKIFLLLAKSRYYRSHFDEALHLAHVALKITEKTKHDELKCKLHHTLAMIQLDLGRLELAEKHEKMALEIAKNLGDTYYLGKCLNTLGVITFQKGNLQDALTHQLESLKYKKKIGSLPELARNHFNLGLIYHEKGDIGKAIHYYEQSLLLWTKAKRMGGVATALTNIGIIYREKGQLEKAKAKLEESYQLWKKGGYGHSVHAAETLFHLIETCLGLNDWTCTEKCMESLQKLGNETESNIIKFLSRLSRVMVLRSTHKLQDLGKALEIVKDLCHEPPSYHTYTVKAHLIWADLVLKDLKLASSAEKIEELRNIIKKIDVIANLQGSPRLIAEAKLLQAKMLVYDLKMADALKMLGEAEAIATEKGLTRLAKKISHEFDNLLLKLTHFEEMLAKNFSNYEKLEVLGLQDLIDALLKTATEQSHKLTPDTPILFLITDKRGITLHSRSFSEIKQSHQNMMGGIIMAINSVMKTVFSEKDPQIQRIVHDDLFIIVIPENTLYFCYALRGSSFFGIEKLKAFISLVKSNQHVMKSLIADIPSLTDDTRRLLDEMADKIFLKQTVPHSNLS